MLYIGIDPGKGGGVVALTPLGIHSVSVFGSMTELATWQLFRGFKQFDDCIAVIEKIPSITFNKGRNNSASNIAELYGHYRAIRMAMCGAGISYSESRPQDWQKYHGIESRRKTETDTAWKKRLMFNARKLFPRINMSLAVSDAYLIAEYCRRVHKRVNQNAEDRNQNDYDT